MERATGIHAAAIVGQRANCALGALALGANVVESGETLFGLYQITVGMGAATLVGGISGVTGVTAASDAVVMEGAGTVYSVGLAIVGPATLSVRGFAGGVDAASGEFGLDNFAPGVGAVGAYHTIADNC